MFGDRRKRGRRPAGLSGLDGTVFEHFKNAEELADNAEEIIRRFQGSELSCADAFVVYGELARTVSLLGGELFSIPEAEHTGRWGLLSERFLDLEAEVESLYEALAGCLRDDARIGMWTGGDTPERPRFRVIRGGKS